jgi:hypothetical protein
MVTFGGLYIISVKDRKKSGSTALKVLTTLDTEASGTGDAVDLAKAHTRYITREAADPKSSR